MQPIKVIRPDLIGNDQCLTRFQVVYLAKRDPSKVALICGGGSGHEPAHAGFVGKIDSNLQAARYRG